MKYIHVVAFCFFKVSFYLIWFLFSCFTQHLMVTARRFTVIIEEKLLLKLLTFFGYGKTEGGMWSFLWFFRSERLCFSKTISASYKGCVSEVEKLDENLYEKASEEAGPRKRYYFENLKISLPQVKLSVFTSHKLPPDLKVSCYVLLKNPNLDWWMVKPRKSA